MHPSRSAGIGRCVEIIPLPTFAGKNRQFTLSAGDFETILVPTDLVCITLYARSVKFLYAHGIYLSQHEKHVHKLFLRTNWERTYSHFIILNFFISSFNEFLRFTRRALRLTVFSTCKIYIFFLSWLQPEHYFTNF